MALKTQAHLNFIALFYWPISTDRFVLLRCPLAARSINRSHLEDAWFQVSNRSFSTPDRFGKKFMLVFGNEV